ncbi:D-serine ammonia-lyase [Bacillus sp. FJAT-27251]|uniref:D-serine ammonia-lyase n=1 Tax=Bacillus sp. FJAT-27251 TaxID=1684142 RepID=UPI0006A77964|nr:D-serine ammonia-lyase [Bacillus sp. FJAT-27251]
MESKLDAKIHEYMIKQPFLQSIIKKEPLLWVNPDYSFNPKFPVNGTGTSTIREAEKRFQAFMPLLAKLFPEIEGNLESPLNEIREMKKVLEKEYSIDIGGRLLLKRDDALPVAGSIKARGGFHEVLALAESLAFEHGLLKSKQDDYLVVLSDRAKQIFGQYTIAVGSTGNLGLSIGMIGSALGFQVAVHMSADAKEWKKNLLRKHVVKVVEHASDYTLAVEAARKESEADKQSYFVDDENSQLLFAGYAAVAYELKKQLDEKGIQITPERPLYVYLPCGVGGGPGGITFGLKSVFGADVHCFFAEPTSSPAMLVGMATKLHNHVSVQDFGLDNKTEADGLAVGTPSAFVGKIMEDLLCGIYTISDDELFRLLYSLSTSENIFLEPSALAGMKGPFMASRASTERFPNTNQAVHVVWATGGSLVPQEMRESFLRRGAPMAN